MHPFPSKLGHLGPPPPNLPKKPSHNVLSPNRDRYCVSKTSQIPKDPRLPHYRNPYSKLQAPILPCVATLAGFDAAIRHNDPSGTVERVPVTSISSAPNTSHALEMSTESDTIFQVIIHGIAKVYKVEEQNLHVFGVLEQQSEKRKGPYVLDFGITIPHDSDSEAFFESFARLLRSIHRPTAGQDANKISLRDIWHIAHLNCTLKLKEAQVDVLGRATDFLVANLISQKDIVQPREWAMAISVSLLFQWPQLYRRLASHLAYTCTVVKDVEGKTQILNPQGEPALDKLCGKTVVDDIVQARAKLLKEIIKLAEHSIGHWINGLAHYGCKDCKKFRIAGLSTVLIEVGLFPHKGPEDITKSIRQICEEMDEDKHLGPMSRMFSGKCYACDRAPRSYLFPVEDILTTIGWDRHLKLRQNLSLHFGDAGKF